MPVSLIPYGKKRSSDAINIKGIIREYRYMVPVFYIFIFLFILLIGSFIWKNILENKVVEMQGEKEILLELVENSRTKAVVGFARRVQNLDKIIDRRQLSSKLFSVFEASIHNNTFLTKFNLDTNTKVLLLEGVAPNFEILGQQFVIWNEKSDFIKAVDLRSFNKNSAGQIEFSASLVVKEGYLK
ncbi:MAG: hypothetical protein A3H51_01405 [Candidatus Spechtbacteria bacterium RIFCSPLOWO2_02_FULL_38_8]|uniref:Uncharacterized protein n=1 Tax=Candidatus Spechtbacteria bacterium RIFCSPLOWO2_02_FULL_38_8 TaxID=1802164 RepID=A0A1G2HLP6_9BACT|nr:MAG: hypothetical protein A3H51_01405 [Candidatus Spechtbacteria bacterium RIFCSPLOWO2_02_FULL_38_8]